MRQFKTIVFCAAMALAGSGCLSSRVLKSTVQAGDKNVTLVQTYDTYSILWWPVSAKHRFWKCSETPGAIDCGRVCDTEGSDLACPPIGAFSTDNAVQ
jgi:hypothetical protein